MITLYSEDELFRSALGYFRLAFPKVDLSDRSFFGLLARAFARFMALAQLQILQVDQDAVPAYQQDADGNVRSRCSPAALDAWAFTFGLPSGTPGIYGRRGATQSTGGSAIPGVTTTGVTVTAGTEANAGDVTVRVTATVALDGPPNTQRVQFVSTTRGAAANLPAGTVLTWISPPPGLTATCALATPLVGAEDIETDAALVARLLRRIQQPPRGGTAADYRAWAEESVDVSGAPLNIFRGFVYPLRSGLGSVDLVALYGGSGLGRRPPAGEIAKVQAYLELLRPVTATVRVLAPLMPTSNALRIRVRVTPSGAKNGLYRWDWDDFGSPTIITAHTATTITVASVPAALFVAFASGAGPRVQLIISAAGASPVPFVARVVGIAANTLTLDAPIPTAPTDGVDYFRAGSAVVVPIAQRLLAYVDSLGPSRQSGYADPNDGWEDRVLLERITDVALETRDTDGTRMVDATPGFGVTSVQLAVGPGGYSATAYAPRDVGSGIELAYLRAGGIEVLQ